MTALQDILVLILQINDNKNIDEKHREMNEKQNETMNH